MQFDNSPMMWSLLTQGGAYATAFIYGMIRREHTRFWPILVLGAILDIAAEVWFASKPPVGPGLYLGMLYYPLYCMVGVVAGIVVRVVCDSLIHRTARNKLAHLDGNSHRNLLS